MKYPEQIPVLIIEDSEWLADSFARVLDMSGYNSYIAHNAIEAINLVDECNPSVIILDMLLTGSTAFVLMHELQTYDDTAKIPIILCTNLATELSIDELEPYGVKKIVNKATMHPEDLVASIKSVL